MGGSSKGLGFPPSLHGFAALRSRSYVPGPEQAAELACQRFRVLMHCFPTQVTRARRAVHCLLQYVGHLMGGL